MWRDIGQPRSRECTPPHASRISHHPADVKRHTPQTPVPVFVSPIAHSDPHSIPTCSSRRPDGAPPSAASAVLHDGLAAPSRRPQRCCHSWCCRCRLRLHGNVPRAQTPSMSNPRRLLLRLTPARWRCRPGSRRTPGCGRGRPPGTARARGGRTAAAPPRPAARLHRRRRASGGSAAGPKDTCKCQAVAMTHATLENLVGVWVKSR
jgi:hypothetical protein